MILLGLLLLSSAVTGQQRLCGYTPIVQSRVIGGQDAQPGAWPWQIALKRYGSFICGGSLISADWVVTAAHCVAGSSNPANYRIVVGDHNRNTNEGTEQEVRAQRIISHPSYNSPSRINNDIALIQLSTPVHLSQRVNPVCLPSHDSDVPTGSKCYITGWGKIRHPGSSHPILQQAMMPPIDNNRCKQKIQASGVAISFTRQMLCAGVENTILSGCHGDSGGPYVCLNADGRTYTLHGAVSWGSGSCNARQLFTVFARVTQFRAWIKQHTGIGGGGGIPPTPTKPNNGGGCAFSCNFDKSMCNFVQDKSDDFDWTRYRGSTPSSNTGPSGDHTTGNGYYMYIETSGNWQGAKARLLSPKLQFNGNMCLNFSYHMYGSHMGTLNVSISGTTVFSTSGNKGDLWLSKEIDVNFSGMHAVTFEGIRGSGYQSDIAIDDFSLTPGSCSGSTPTPPAAIGCDFDQSMCGFVQDRNDSFDWTRNSGSTPSSNTGPSADHTGKNGYYMYIETSYNQKGDNAILLSPKFSFSVRSGKCLQFYYHMYGAGMGTLNVFLNGARVFTACGDKGNKWHKAAIDVNLSGMHAVMFEGIKGKTFQSDIAIDDVFLDQRPCSAGGSPTPPVTPPRPTAPAECSNYQVLNDSDRAKGFKASSNFKCDRPLAKRWYKFEGGAGVKMPDQCVPTHHCGTHAPGWLSGGAHPAVADGAVLRKVCFHWTSGCCQWSTNIRVRNCSGFYVYELSDTPACHLRYCGDNDQGSTVAPTTVSTQPPVPSSMRCSFDASMCGFVQDKNDTFDWTRNYGGTPSSGTGPTADHSGNGYYMYTEATPQNLNDKARLISPTLQFRGSACIEFYYHMYGSNMGTLNVYLRGRNGRMALLLTISGDKGNVWHKANKNVYIWGQNDVIFEGVVGPSFQSDIAIDDFEVRPGRCSFGTTPPVGTTPTPPVPTPTGSPPLTNLSCNFDQSLCGFAQDKNDAFDWTWNNGNTPSWQTGPSGDHTSGSGYYMYTEASYPSQGDIAKLISPNLRFSGSMCIQFYYHMYGASMGTLNVYIYGRKIFSASGDKGNVWHMANINFYSWGDSRVTFEGVIGSSFQSDIAIDDFTFTRGRCPSNATVSPPVTTAGPTPPTPTLPPLPSLTCDFDITLCGFVQDSNDTFDWTQNRGGTSSSSTGPSADHTSGNGAYMYTEASSPRQQGDIAKLTSPKLMFRGSSCIQFYYHMYGGDMGTLNVYVNGRKEFSASGNKGNIWYKANLNVYSWGVSEVTFEGVVGSSYESDIAIDDFNFTRGRCPSGSTAPPPVTTPVAPVTTLSCNFDNSLCGFVQDSNDVFDWTQHSGSTSSSSTGPSADHTSGYGNYMYIETSSPRQPGDNAKLISPKLLFRGSACLIFYYHMHGASMGSFNVTINGNAVFKATGDQGNMWLEAKVDVNLWGRNAITFEGVRGSSYTGDLAIDDVRFGPGNCSSITPPPPITPGTPPPQGSCGIRPHTRIVGGVNAKHGDWPWQVQLRTTSGFPYCGGTLVTPLWVVTATHCVENKSPSSIVIRAGAHRRVNAVGTEQDIRVSKVITHSSYHSPVRYAHDIALLKLEKPAQLSKYVNLACLPHNVSAPTNGTKCWITGWGRLASGGATPDYLQQVSVPVVSRARCDKAYPGKIHDSMICAGLDQGGIDTCQGDSGGPMVCETRGRFYLQGATSWGYGCASPGKFGVYAKVKYLMAWIKSQMSRN